MTKTVSSKAVTAITDPAKRIAPVVDRTKKRSAVSVKTTRAFLLKSSAGDGFQNGSALPI